MAADMAESESGVARKVVLGVTGGIGAYRAPELVRALRKRGFRVQVILTRAARAFVSPLALATVSGEPVLEHLFDPPADGEGSGDSDGDGVTGQPDDPADIRHISLTEETDLFLVAPATAHAIARLALGLADDFLTTFALACRAPLLVAPAMNTNMLEHPATAAHLETLRARGARIVPPGRGELACGWMGPGRLPENEALVAAVEEALAETSATIGPRRGAPRITPPITPPITPRFAAAGEAVEESPAGTDAWARAEPAASRQSPDLAGRRVLIAAGPTREPLDPVRFLSNRSSGRMGFALAREALSRGAEVTLVLGPGTGPPPADCPVIPVETAAEMHREVLRESSGCDAVVMAAAVADYRPAEASPEKHKSGPRRAAGEGDPPVLTLVPNPDILADLGARRAAADSGPGHPAVLIGFAAETGDPEAEAARKLDAKRCDLIVGNRVGPGRVFDRDLTEAVLVERRTDAPPRITRRDPETKAELASAIWTIAARRLAETDGPR